MFQIQFSIYIYTYYIYCWLKILSLMKFMSVSLIKSFSNSTVYLIATDTWNIHPPFSLSLYFVWNVWCCFRRNINKMHQSDNFEDNNRLSHSMNTYHLLFGYKIHFSNHFIDSGTLCYGGRPIVLLD